jgi:hypothetical protein
MGAIVVVPFSPPTSDVPERSAVVVAASIYVATAPDRQPAITVGAIASPTSGTEEAF